MTGRWRLRQSCMQKIINKKCRAKQLCGKTKRAGREDLAAVIGSQVPTCLYSVPQKLLASKLETLHTKAQTKHSHR